MKKKIQVFISYSHDSLELKGQVIRLTKQLRSDGINCLFDQDMESPDVGWPMWMEKSITDSKYVLMICTKGYYNKFYSFQTGGKGVKWEGAIITQELYENEGKSEKFIPIIFGEYNVDYIPKIFRRFTYYDLADDSVYKKLFRRLANQTVKKKPSTGDNIIKFPSNNRESKNNETISQSIKGNNNMQFANVNGNVSINTPATPKVYRMPAPNTIGANSLLKQAIEERFNKLGEERAKRFDSAFSVMYKNFKKDFGIKKHKWTTIWDWPEGTAGTIIKYLDEKYSNTIAGRRESAEKKGRLLPTKGTLYKRERELLSQIDLEISSPEVIEALKKYFCVESHTKLDLLKHWLWVLYLENAVREIIGE